jgi:hypothetical protein
VQTDAGKPKNTGRSVLAGVMHEVIRNLAKVGVEGSKPVARSRFSSINQ